MADLANKYAENVTGTFYVDDQCIDCDLCRETAPANFTRNDDGGHSYVYKQPLTDEETHALQGSDGRLPGGGHRLGRRVAADGGLRLRRGRSATWPGDENSASAARRKPRAGGMARLLRAAPAHGRAFPGGRAR